MNYGLRQPYVSVLARRGSRGVPFSPSDLGLWRLQAGAALANPSDVAQTIGAKSASTAPAPVATTGGARAAPTIQHSPPATLLDDEHPRLSRSHHLDGWGWLLLWREGASAGY